MSDFQPGDLIIHKKAMKRSDYGEVLHIPASRRKPDKTLVYKQREVWIHNTTLANSYILLSEWDTLHRAVPVHKDIKNYWMEGGTS